MNDLLFVVRSVLSHHVRAMERRTLRCGMETSWLNTEWLSSDGALEEVKEWFECLDTEFGREEVEDTAAFTKILMEKCEAEEFLISVSPLKKEPELAESIDYLGKLTQLAELRLQAIACADSHASVAYDNW